MIHRISPAEAHERITKDGYVYVDVRSVPEFEAGHPEGAFNVPWAHAGPSGMEPNPRFVAVMEARFGKSAKVVLGCQTGNRSMRAAEALVAAGFGELFEQRAGWAGSKDAFGRVTEPGWQRAGLPTEVGAPPGRSWTDLEAG